MAQPTRTSAPGSPAAGSPSVADDNQPTTPREIVEQAERDGGRPPNQPTMAQGGSGVPVEAAPTLVTNATVTVQAEGAAPVVVEIKGAPVAIPAGEVDVVVIGVGTFGAEGIAKLGEERTIPIVSFSKAWMRPRRASDRKKLEEAGKL